MSAQTIYHIKPTVLMVKRHNKTGLLYLCKTTRIENAKNYKGSGVYWKRHLKEHGNDFSTIWISKVYHDSSIVADATSLSEEHDVVNSNKWANLIYENGLDGYNKPATIHNLICENCSTPFQHRNGTKKFCCKKCEMSGRPCPRTGFIKEKVPNTECSECQTPIFRYPSHIKKAKLSFCNKSCTASYYNKLYNKSDCLNKK